MEEVFIFADDRHLVFRGTAPNLKVRRLSEPQVKRMVTFDSAFGEKTGESDGKLVINKESHEPCKTG